MTFTEQKIEEVYKVVEKYMPPDTPEYERQVVKNALRNIAASAMDDARNNISDLMLNEARKYLQQ